MIVGRRVSVITFKALGEKKWGRVMGYGRRWATETAFSTLSAYTGNTTWLKTWKA